MNDTVTTIAKLKKKIRDFSDERGWTQNDNAKDLAIALSVEASELMEIFQWVHSDKAYDIIYNEKELEHLKEEIADVFWYLVRICNLFNIDLTRSVEEKAVKNALKYPVKKSV